MGNDLKDRTPLSGKMSQLDFKILYRYSKFSRFEALVIDLLGEKILEAFPAKLTFLSKRMTGNLDFQFLLQVKLIVQYPALTEVFKWGNQINKNRKFYYGWKFQPKDCSVYTWERTEKFINKSRINSGFTVQVKLVNLSSRRCIWSLNRLQQLLCKVTAPSESPSPSECVFTQRWVNVSWSVFLYLGSQFISILWQVLSASSLVWFPLACKGQHTSDIPLINAVRTGK